ncbi:three-Cys-motif partner protein TcmP [Thioalkalivibrio sp.]|uniref:three-Cys-motif partner protein TcmP n=1 Tax=Thioalkalivibrio sp. TaxID=2093813 RepID=UPI0039757D4C
MPIKDIHETPFSEETILKLDIFMDYAEAWLPVFVHSRTHRKIAIFDFFAGPGYDSNRVPGSPIRLLSTIKKYETAIRANNKQILIFLNEFDKAKHPKLIQSVNSYLEDNSMLKGNISVKIENRDFEEVFFASNQALNSPIPCLIYCDQNGVSIAARGRSHAPEGRPSPR